MLLTLSLSLSLFLFFRVLRCRHVTGRMLQNRFFCACEECRLRRAFRIRVNVLQRFGLQGVGRMEARALTDSELLEALTELHARVDQLQARVDHLLDLINRQYASIDRLNFRHSETWARLCSFGQRLQRVEGRPQDTDAEAASCSFLQSLD